MSTRERPLVETNDVARIVGELASAGLDGETWMGRHGIALDVVSFVADQIEGSFQRALVNEATHGKLDGDLGPLIRACISSAFQIGFETAVQYRSTRGEL